MIPLWVWAVIRSLRLQLRVRLWLKQEEDICINCGEVTAGTSGIDERGGRFFRLMLETAAGRTTKSTGHGDGQSEFVAWQLGAVM